VAIAKKEVRKMPKDGEKKKKRDNKEKKVKVSVLYEVTIKGIDKLARDDNGNKMYVQWKRGKKSANHGKTKEAVVQYNFVQWDEKLSIKSTLLQAPSTGEFEPKTIDFHIVQLAGPKFKKKDEVGMITMNLSDYAQPTAPTQEPEPSGGPKAWNVIQSVQFPLEGYKRKGSEKNMVMGLESVPQFEVVIKSRWLKYNGKFLVQAKKDRESGKPTVKIGDEEFDLQTDREGSDDDGDTTLGGGSDEDSDAGSEFEDDRDDDFSDTTGSGKSGKNNFDSSQKSSSGSRGGPQEEIQKLKQQLRQVNETAQIRLENIAAQRREIEELRAQLDGSKPTSPKVSGGDEQINSLIKTIGLYYKKDKESSERTCHWFGFTATLTTLFTGMALSEGDVPASLQDRLPDLQGAGIDLDKAEPSADVMRGVSPTARTALVLEVMLREIYLGLLKAVYKDLDNTLLPVIFEHQKDSIEKMEMLSKRKGAPSRQPFTWKLSALAAQMAGNRVPLIIQLQFFTQVFYYVGAKLWNALLDQPELCTYTFGFHLKYALSELRSWVTAQQLQNEEFNPSHQLNHVMDAAGVLVVDKSFFETAKIPQDVIQTFPNLSLHEIKYLLETYVPDRSAQEKGIPTSVKRKIDAAAAQAKDEPSSLELDPYAAVTSLRVHQKSSKAPSSGGKEKREKKGRR